MAKARPATVLLMPVLRSDGLLPERNCLLEKRGLIKADHAFAAQDIPFIAASILPEVEPQDLLKHHRAPVSDAIVVFVVVLHDKGVLVARVSRAGDGLAGSSGKGNPL